MGLGENSDSHFKSGYAVRVPKQQDWPIVLQ